MRKRADLQPSVPSAISSSASLEAAEDVKVREIVRLLVRDGWKLARQRGSHRQFKHPGKPGLVTVAGGANEDLAPRTLRSILRQAGMKP